MKSAKPLLVARLGWEGARWRPLEALHVTLRFFGEIREDVARDLDAELSAVRAAPFEIELAGVGAFGDGPDIHAIWAGVAETEPLLRLARACETAARRAGLKAETRHYRPHVTLAYLRRADPGEVAAWIQANNLLKSPPIRALRTSASIRVSSVRSRRTHRLEAEYPLS